jgi:hypothetical protein
MLIAITAHIILLIEHPYDRIDPPISAGGIEGAGVALLELKSAAVV